MLSSNLHDFAGGMSAVSILIGYWHYFQNSQFYGTLFMVTAFYLLCIVVLEKVRLLEKQRADYLLDNTELVDDSQDIMDTEHEDENTTDENTTDENTEDEDEDADDEDDTVPYTAEDEDEDEDEDEVEREDAEAYIDTDVHYCGEESCGNEITVEMNAGCCAGCKLVYYCNLECQKKDWKAGHKLVCNPNPTPTPAADDTSDNKEDTLPTSPSEAASVVEDVPVLEAVPLVEVPVSLAPPPPMTPSHASPPPPPPPPTHTSKI